MKLGLLVIKTNRSEVLKNQYEKLGIEFVHHVHETGPFHFSADLGATTFEIYPLPKGETKVDTSTRIGFEVDDLNALLTQLQYSDWQIKMQPELTPFGYTTVLKDLDGRTVELTQKKNLPEN